LPVTTAGMTVNRYCASGLQSSVLPRNAALLMALRLRS
jgi:hypothetical protein